MSDFRPEETLETEKDEKEKVNLRKDAVQAAPVLLAGPVRPLSENVLKAENVVLSQECVEIPVPKFQAAETGKAGETKADDTVMDKSAEAEERTEQLPQEEAGAQPVLNAAKPLSNDAVTEHTASLWKYIPVPQDQPDPFPEYRHHLYDFPGSKVIAARVRGKKHKHEGTNCDDWYEVGHDGDIVAAAVSDGAGSRRLSRIGARQACRAGVKSLQAGLKEMLSSHTGLRRELAMDIASAECRRACGILAVLVQKAVMAAYKSVENAFGECLVDPVYTKLLGRAPVFTDFAGTFLLALLVPLQNEKREKIVITCQIGDGMLALLDTGAPFETSVKLMGVPDNGDFSGETDFLTSPKITQAAELQKRTMISKSTADLLFLMTDGVADDYFPNETQMHRLYFDLAANGILPVSLTGQGTRLKLTRDEWMLLDQVFVPQAYPWVNDQSVKIGLQYTKRIGEVLPLDKLWQDPAVLQPAAEAVLATKELKDPSKRLQVWLDNYVERGSFDDRTLVIVRM